MTKEVLISKINAGETDLIKIKKWIKCLPGSSYSRKPNKSKVGDVYMHHIFKHPYILAKKSGDYWYCLLLTSNESHCGVIEKTNSRFFSDSYFTHTIFKTLDPNLKSSDEGSFINVFDNNRQINKIFNYILNDLNKD